jgi:superfamily II DNA helicase RecQ
VPIIALTATATPKVQQDIQKNLGMTKQMFTNLLLIVQIYIMKYAQTKCN